MSRTSGISRVRAEDAGPQEVIGFAPFCLDLRAERLLRGSQPVPLQPKAFAVLRHLVERPGALVTKHELLDAVWADAAVSENSLTQSIRQLRRALQDDSTPARFIETVHRRGFRFVAAVTSQLLGTSDQLSVISDQLSLITAPFVGRATELHRLDALLGKAQRGQRQVVLVTGEAGIGKTTIIQSFLAALAQAPAASQVLVARGQAIEQAGAREPYLPVLDALGRLARIADPQRVVPLLRRAAPAWLAQMPWLLEPADAVALRQSLIDVRPERMLRELAIFLEEFSATATLILVLEDLHWSDPSTVELLLMLAQRSEPARLLVIGTYRPAEASLQGHPLVRAKHTLQLRRQCTEMALEYLTRADVEAYLDRRFPRAEWPKALAGLIHDHTDGNPLFMVAVIDQLITRGWLVATDPGWALAVPLETLRLEVPDDLRDMIRFQFQGMGPADRSLLEAVSVNGGTFTTGEIAQAIDAEPGAAESACEQLVRTYRFLRVAGDAAVPGERTARQYTFIHALYQHVVYEEIPAERRRRLHQRVGEALERAHSDGTAQNAFRLAAHFERGGDPARAITYFAAAAAEAQQRFAPREAIGCLEAALRLADQLPDVGQRSQREIELRVPLTAALNLVYGYASDEVRASCERTRALCEQSGSLPELYEALYALWYSQAMRAEKDTARETAERLVEISERLGSPEQRLRAGTTRGQTALYEGKYQEAVDTLQAAIASWETISGTSNGSAYGPDPIMAAYANRGLALWFLGYPDSARHSYRKALALAQEAGLPFTLAAAHVHVAFVELLCGNATEAFRLADRGLALATEHAFPFWHAVATAFRGWAQMHSGPAARTPEASGGRAGVFSMDRSLLRRGSGQGWSLGAAKSDRLLDNAVAGVEDVRAAIALFDSGGMKLAKPLLLALLAEGGLRLGSLSEGLTAVEEGLHLTHTTLDRFYEPELWRLKGDLLLAQSKEKKKTARSASRNGQVKEAEQCFQCALKMAREHGARSLELRAALSLARLEQMAGERGTAHARLAEVYGCFTEGHDTLDLQEARTLLG
jgi:DNA-binding winged helix-turn-helix (wHTH) protein/tetratricopeptide (TPR) repeat protein/type II secretory pathway predicted ATPase ExeA